MPKFPKNTGYKMKPKRGELFNYDRSAFDDAPIIKKKLEEGVKAEANKDGSIYVDPSVDLASKKGKKIIEHEKVHLDQMAQGKLQYTDNEVIWKKDTKSPARVYARIGGRLIDKKTGKSDVEGGAFEWEKDAYENS